MRNPLDDKVLNDIFQSDRSVWLKMGGGALVCGLTSAGVVSPDQNGLAFTLVSVSAAAAIGALIGLMLSVKDAVKRRREASKYVNAVLRLFFGMGAISLLVWIVTLTALAITFLILDIMTVSKPHRPAASDDLPRNRVAVACVWPVVQPVSRPLTPFRPALD